MTSQQKNTCHGLLPPHALFLEIIKAKPSKPNNSAYFTHFKGTENTEKPKYILVEQLQIKFIFTFTWRVPTLK